MPVIPWREVKETPAGPGYGPARGQVVGGLAIEVGLLRLPGGTAVEPPAGGHEQILVITAGRARCRLAEAERLVGPGDALLIPPGSRFAAEVLEDLTVYRFRDRGDDWPDGDRPPGGPRCFTWAEMASDFITPRYSSGQGPTITGERIEVAYMTYPAGTEGKPHVHPNEQLQVPLRGRVRYLLETPQEAGPGEVVLIPAELRHGAQILEDFTVLNAKNIVAGWSVYHARWET